MLTSNPRHWLQALLRHHNAMTSGNRVEGVEGRERELCGRLTRGRIDLALTVVRFDNARDMRQPG